MIPKRFHDLMLVYLDEYRVHLLQARPHTQTIRHCSIVKEFIDYLYNPNLIGSIDQIAVSMGCSRFMAHYKKQKKKVVAKDTMKKILKGYFVFLDGKYGLRNETLMRSLER